MTCHNKETVLEYPPVDFTDTTVTWCNFTNEFVLCIDDNNGGVITLSEETLLEGLELLLEVKLEESVDE